jgi:hypothetical protein
MSVYVRTILGSTLITKLKEECVKFRDASQAGMTVVYLTVETLFGKSQVLGVTRMNHTMSFQFWYTHTSLVQPFRTAQNKSERH